jgi:hypothetical protein
METYHIFAFDLLDDFLSSEFDDAMRGSVGDYPREDSIYGELNLLQHFSGIIPAIPLKTTLEWTLVGADFVDYGMYAIWHMGFGIFVSSSEEGHHEGSASGVDNPHVLHWEPPPGAQDCIGFVKRNLNIDLIEGGQIMGAEYTTDSGADSFRIQGGVEAEGIKLPKSAVASPGSVGGAARGRRPAHGRVVAAPRKGPVPPLPEGDDS